LYGSVAKNSFPVSLLFQNFAIEKRQMDYPFKWRQYQLGIILLNVRLYLRYSPSCCDLKEMMSESSLAVDHTSTYRWVQKFAPEIDKRSQPFLKQTNDSW